MDLKKCTVTFPEMILIWPGVSRPNCIFCTYSYLLFSKTCRRKYSALLKIGSYLWGKRCVWSGCCGPDVGWDSGGQATAVCCCHSDAAAGPPRSSAGGAWGWRPAAWRHLSGTWPPTTPKKRLVTLLAVTQAQICVSLESSTFQNGYTNVIKAEFKGSKKTFSRILTWPALSASWGVCCESSTSKHFPESCAAPKASWGLPVDLQWQTGHQPSRGEETASVLPPTAHPTRSDQVGIEDEVFGQDAAATHKQLLVPGGLEVVHRVDAQKDHRLVLLEWNQTGNLKTTSPQM